MSEGSFILNSFFVLNGSCLSEPIALGFKGFLLDPTRSSVNHVLLVGKDDLGVVQTWLYQMWPVFFLCVCVTYCRDYRPPAYTVRHVQVSAMITWPEGG